ncbi:hypothetical protein GGR54DRAFT_607589 [Hypoxylon sp. NC1633]|nr:hypothetical protein GGR54DRAFT_607589 [Hypoxylon sp. NC1633]
MANESWDDPHPGERLEIPLGMPAGLHICPQTVSGNFMGGVAVKARGAYDNGFCASRHGGHGRHHSNLPKSLKIPAKVLEEPEAKPVCLVTSESCGFAAPRPLQLHTPPEPFQPLEFETDTETEVGAETGTLVGEGDGDQLKMMAIGNTHVSDFSNYLGITQQEDDDASVTVVDSETFTRTSSVDDAYGWDAELDRKMKCRVSSTDSGCPFPYSRRGADGGKRSLLHRVFSTQGRRVNSGF